MRTESTYAVDAMNRYNGDHDAAIVNVAAYYSEGGLSPEYFVRVVMFMNWVDMANNHLVWQIPVKHRRRVVKAMRKKMPRVHTEVSNWRLTYNVAFADAAYARVGGNYRLAWACVREARHIRQIYL